MTSTEQPIAFLVYPYRDGVVWCAACYNVEQDYLPYATDPLTADEYVQLVSDEVEENETPIEELNCAHCGRNPLQRT